MSNLFWGTVQVNLNSLADALLRDIVKWINIDDLDLPDFRDIIKPPSADYFHLLNGCVTNLKDISRAGDSKIFYENRALIIQTGICFNKLNFSYDYGSYLQGYATNGKIIGNIQKLQICFQISLTNLMLGLESFTISIEHIELDMKTNNIWGWFSSFNLSWFIKQTIKSLIEEKVRNFLQKMVDNVNKWSAEYRSQILQTDFVRNWIIDKLSHLMIINLND